MQRRRSNFRLRHPCAGGDPVTLVLFEADQLQLQLQLQGQQLPPAAGDFCLGKSHQNRSRWSHADAMKPHRCPVLLGRRGTALKLARCSRAQTCAPLRPPRPAVLGVLRQREVGQRRNSNSNSNNSDGNSNSNGSNFNYSCDSDSGCSCDSNSKSDHKSAKEKQQQQQTRQVARGYEIPAVTSAR